MVHVDLSDTQVDPDVFQILARLPNLRFLYLRGTELKFGERRVEGGFPSLEKIQLSGYVLSEETTDAIKRIPTLRNLDLSFLEVDALTDALIASLPNLEICTVRDAIISTDRMAELEARFPKVEFHFRSPQVDDPL